MKLPFLIFYLTYNACIGFSQVSNGYQHTDLILYTVMVLTSASAVRSYQKEVETLKRLERIKKDFVAELDLFVKATAKQKNVELDCLSYGDSKHLFCAIHPTSYNCLNCCDYQKKGELSEN